jgi:transcriptional coactivator HFI1/ADA1
VNAHNKLVLAIAYNTGRDPPDPGLAPWVSASSDKSSGPATSKPVATSDAGEQRLKTEVMALPPRDRRRIKTVVTDGKDAPEEAMSRRALYEDYYNASRIKAPDSIPASAGGLTKTNWDLEIRKRYIQSLYAETLEFPDAATIYSRMVPICYEESVTAGTSLQSAELVGIAAEIHIKNMLHDLFNRVRANGPRYENGAADGIFTAKFKKKVRKEEADLKAGKLDKNRDDDLLPTEFNESQSRKPLGIGDFKLANRVGPNLFNGMPLLNLQINENLFDDLWDDQDSQSQPDATQPHTQHKISLPVTNGALTNGAIVDDDEMDIDEEDWGWEGTGPGDRDGLDSLLADCLNSGGAVAA